MDHSGPFFVQQREELWFWSFAVSNTQQLSFLKLCFQPSILTFLKAEKFHRDHASQSTSLWPSRRRANGIVSRELNACASYTTGCDPTSNEQVDIIQALLGNRLTNTARFFWRSCSEVVLSDDRNWEESRWGQSSLWLTFVNIWWEI